MSVNLPGSFARVMVGLGWDEVERPHVFFR